MIKVDGIVRVVPAEETIRRMTPVAQSLGVTRLADITGLDRIGLPVYTSVVPDSYDTLSVYNGKGLRREDARAGALMEAIERQTALRTRLPMVEGSVAELRRTNRLVDPQDINHQLASDYSEAKTYSWVKGFDLVSQEACLVPARLAGFLWDDVPYRSCFTISDTTGLAAGNNRVEAIVHAICELIERDSWTFADLGCCQMPFVRRKIVYGRTAGEGEDDLDFYPCVNLDPEDKVVQRFHEAGLQPIARNITSSIGIPTIFATVVDESIDGLPMAHSGLGCGLTATGALHRALTEAAQSRCIDIQAVREDIADRAMTEDAFSLHTRRVSSISKHHWTLNAGTRRCDLADLPSRSFATIEEDLEYLVSRLDAVGLSEIIVVDFTPDITTHSVVRVLIPGIELWASDHGRLGRRAAQFWKQHV
jgi:ribosomal protein S12 methylthiotransferase accessory factor